MHTFHHKPTRLMVHMDHKDFLDYTIYYINAELGQTTGEIKFKYTPKSQSVYIIDIITSRENRGLGSLLLDKAIQQARSLGATCVEGYLAVVDQDHYDKLVHFYSKFGFRIIPCYEPGKLATIELTL